MKYRVEIDVSFDKKEDAVALMNYVEKIKTVTEIASETIGKPTLNIQQRVTMHECCHDENPPKPCSGYKSVDFNGAEKVWA